MDHLDTLEARSVFLFREAYANFKSLGMLWSIGKDSTVLLWLARKAFFGHVPFPLIHIDTSFKIPEMIAYRDRLAAEWNLHLIYGENRAALDEKRTFPDGAVSRLTCCGLLKTEALTKTLSGEWPRYRFNAAKKAYEPDPNTAPFTGVIAGVRADEEGSRSKERYFSPRNTQNTWDVADQPPEFWNQYKTEFAPGTHLRIHPLLDWTELNIWEYIEREKNSDGIALLQPGRRPAVPVARLLSVHEPGGVGRANAPGDHRRAAHRQIREHRGAVRPRAGQ
jgi:sulfate adenylyltransferase subunit 2